MYMVTSCYSFLLFVSTTKINFWSIQKENTIQCQQLVKGQQSMPPSFLIHLPRDSLKGVEL